MKQVFLQSAAALQRRIFVKPKELELGYSMCLELVLPLYSLCERGNYWSETLTSHILKETMLEQTPGDLSLIYRRPGKDVTAVSGNYVDDLLHAAPKVHRHDLEKSPRSQFECSPSQELPTDFLGYEISCLHWVFTIPCRTTSRDSKRCRWTRLSATTQHFAPRYYGYHTHDLTSRLSRAWLAHQVHILAINKEPQRVNDTADITLSSPKLDSASYRLVAYSDASFDKRSEKSSQIGFIICLADRTDAMCVLSFRSNTYWSVAKSPMAAETLAFAAVFDAGYLLRRNIKIMFGQPLPLLVLTDSKSLFGVLTSNKQNTEARLMIDIFAARQSYHAAKLTA